MQIQRKELKEKRIANRNTHSQPKKRTHILPTELYLRLKAFLMLQLNSFHGPRIAYTHFISLLELNTRSLTHTRDSNSDLPVFNLCSVCVGESVIYIEFTHQSILQNGIRIDFNSIAYLNILGSAYGSGSWNVFQPNSVEFELFIAHIHNHD